MVLLTEKTQIGCGAEHQGRSLVPPGEVVEDEGICCS